MYMSPEQLSQDNGSHGYLGSAVDVWASGVLLIVMLVSHRWSSPVMSIGWEGKSPLTYRAGHCRETLYL